MELKAKLTKASKRLRLRVFLQRLSTVAAITFVIGAVFVLTAAWQGWKLPSLFIIVSILVGATVIIAAVMTAFEDTGLTRTTRLLEAKYPFLHSSLSTSLELDRSADSLTPLRQAQRNHATALANGLDLSEGIPFRLPRRLILALATGTLILGASLVLHVPLAHAGIQRASVNSGPSARFSAPEQANLSSNLQQLADIFSEETDMSADSYLNAIGHRLRELSANLESEEVSREQLTGELERLLEHTRAALEIQERQGHTTPQRDLTELLRAALQDVQQPSDQAMVEAQQQSPAAESTGGELKAETIAATANSPEPQFPSPSLDELLEARQEQETGSASNQSLAQRASRAGSYFEHELDAQTIAELNARALDDALSQAAGEAIGASEQSQEGASSIAGDGTDELFGTEAAKHLNAERIEQMSVTEETDPEGRHVRIEVNPDTEWIEVLVTPLGTAAWNKSTEEEVIREALLTDLRGVTARYHTPVQEQ